MSCLCIAVWLILTVVAAIIVIAIPVFITLHHNEKTSNSSENISKVNDVNQEFSKADFINSLDVFGDNLFRELYQGNPGKNIFFSPFSIQTCLTMTRMGAEGQTALEMDASLNIYGKSMESVADKYHDILLKYENNSLLNVANKMYVMQNYSVRDDYNRTVVERFGAAVENIDFSQSQQAAYAINNWVENSTGGAIKNLISSTSLSSDTRIFLLSAIHFKGEWMTEFPREATSQQDFFLNAPNRVIKLPMMYRKELSYYNIFPELNATALRLPYKNSDLSMLILLPNSFDGLTDLVEKLKHISFETIANQTMDRTHVHIYLPKFKTEFEMELKDTLTKLGMNKMFNSGEFGHMLNSAEPLKISNVIHKAFIEVDEKGTEASAATGLSITTRDGGGIQSLIFKADHPFYYTIISSDNIRLFEGTFIGL
ncbi:antichymotrypsin-2-like [Musca autumnalis]|uniref:antichymotrypsin-2-like n=1 Tax=Musca autumnalis TaxID=221902 RepID=UPI003CE6DB33